MAARVIPAPRPRGQGSRAAARTLIGMGAAPPVHRVGVPPRGYDKTDLLLLGVGGGMPTRVSVPKGRLAEVKGALAKAGLWR